MITTSIFPGRYVQGAGALDLLGEEAARLGKAPLALIDRAIASLVSPRLEAITTLAIARETFGGECCDPEIARLQAIAEAKGSDLIIGIGGGKALDTAKALAHALRVPVIIVPTLASTDAPCSALSVIYTPEGAFQRYLFLPQNPQVVLVDSALIAAAPARFLVAGMGDALSTWFEAEDARVKGAGNMTGRPGGATAHALARLCYDTLLEYGEQALRACERQVVTPALERIIEANTLLSGLGFESGGLSAAHAIHNGLTRLHGTHGFWHGEKVAIGTQALTILGGRPPALVEEVYGFCAAVGLPTTLAGIGLAAVTDAELLEVATAACAEGETIHNAPYPVSPAAVVAALKAGDAIGRAL
ncbi:glycerol dehydrogenase [Roseomonas sp. USHLN139]|uniref:glycerol dehydrogenase n=1 Tax=Roseomonas sp. USHLN139 TaxID=3081298 RepID=UPI003B02A5CD